jgi:hypothetical protein
MRELAIRWEFSGVPGQECPFLTIERAEAKHENGHGVVQLLLSQNMKKVSTEQMATYLLRVFGNFDEQSKKSVLTEMFGKIGHQLSLLTFRFSVKEDDDLVRLYTTMCALVFDLLEIGRWPTRNDITISGEGNGLEELLDSALSQAADMSTATALA